MATLQQSQEEIDERNMRFSTWYQKAHRDFGIDKLSPVVQQKIHDFAKRAFRRGAAFERKKNEIVEVGGM